MEISRDLDSPSAQELMVNRSGITHKRILVLGRGGMIELRPLFSIHRPPEPNKKNEQFSNRTIEQFNIQS